jgi:hypothetical protein
VIAFVDGLISHSVLDDGNLVVAHAGMNEKLQGRASTRLASGASLCSGKQQERRTSSGFPSATTGRAPTEARRWSSMDTPRYRTRSG